MSIKQNTKPCMYMVKNGVCNKKNCLFAHSMEQLSITPCFYNDSCQYPTTCRFIHENENIYQYYVRTQTPIPSLPSSRSMTVAKDTPHHLLNELITNGLANNYNTFIFT